MFLNKNDFDSHENENGQVSLNQQEEGEKPESISVGKSSLASANSRGRFGNNKFQVKQNNEGEQKQQPKRQMNYRQKKSDAPEQSISQINENKSEILAEVNQPVEQPKSEEKKQKKSRIDLIEKKLQQKAMQQGSVPEQDEDDFDSIIFNQKESNQKLLNNQSQVNSENQERPMTATTFIQRQKLLEQQKQMIQQRQQIQFNSQGLSGNTGYIKKLGQNESTYSKEGDIDLEKLKSILGSSSISGQHEPGYSNYSIDSELPKLQKDQTHLEETKIQQIQSIQKQPPQQHEEPQHIMKTSSQSEEQTNFQIQQQTIEENKYQQVESLEDENQDDLRLLEEQRKEEEMRKELKQQNEKIMIDIPKSDEQNQNDILKSPQTQKEESIIQETDKPSEQQQQQSKPIEPKKIVPYPKPLDPVPINDMKLFLTSPSPKGGMIQCTIKRDKSGMARFYPKYHMHLSNGFKYLMSAKKRACNNTSNYLITMNRNDYSKSSPNFLGKVRSNFLGTEFILYDNGMDPKKVKSSNDARAQLGMIFYESNILGTKGPRKMKAIFPRVDENGVSYQYRPLNSKLGIFTDYKDGKRDNMIVCINRPPKWNDQVKAFVLNFFGRVDKPSVKNFQLIEENGSDVILLQFGRVGEELFNLDFQYPMSPLQAFEIALSSFDYKIACE